MPLDETIEIWVVESPGTECKCFSTDKAGARDYANKLGKDAVMWNMMDLNDQKEKA